MGLRTWTALATRSLLPLLALAYGPSLDEDALALQSRLAGSYSTTINAGQVDPANTSIELFDFREDGTVSALLMHRRHLGRAWALVDDGRRANILFKENYVKADGVRREGAWTFPDEECEQPTVSLAEFNFDGNATLTLGHRCNPK